MVIIKFCRWLELNHGPLVSEATTLPTEPQPMPIVVLLVYYHVQCQDLRLKWGCLFRSQTNTFVLSPLIKNGPIPASFCLFSLFSQYNFNNTNWKKHRWCAWDSNSGPQDGRRRWSHGAMAATHFLPLLFFPTKERFEASKRRKMRNVELEEEGDNFWVVLKWWKNRQCRFSC